MIYPFECETCGIIRIERPMTDPPGDTAACSCGKESRRIWTTPRICTVGCSGASDPDEIPREFGVTQNPLDGGRNENRRLERAYQRDIEHKRRNKRKCDSMEMTQSVPAELYHGKIRQTGDKNYWDDPKNRLRHGNTRI